MTGSRNGSGEVQPANPPDNAQAARRAKALERDLLDPIVTQSGTNSQLGSHRKVLESQGLKNAPRRTRTSKLRFRETPCATYACEFLKEFSAFSGVEASVMQKGGACRGTLLPDHVVNVQASGACLRYGVAHFAACLSGSISTTRMPPDGVFDRDSRIVRPLAGRLQPHGRCQGACWNVLTTTRQETP